MSKQEYLEILKRLPEILPCTVEMANANSIIPIFDGDYLIKNDSHEISLTGSIFFKWFPVMGAHFWGKTDLLFEEIISIEKLTSCEIIVQGSSLGYIFITNTDSKYKGQKNETIIQGTLLPPTIKGDKTIPVEKIIFSVPNLREFLGDSVKKSSKEQIKPFKNRILLETDKYQITLDKCHDFKERSESLTKNGGYNILYGGEIISKKGSITHDNSKDIILCLNTFLTFLNGRQTSALFIQGIFANELIWQDYTCYNVDIYKSVNSWPQNFSFTDFNGIWNNFISLWQDPDDKAFLKSLVHWYTESNSLTGSIEGSIIMSQTALELIYNWWIVENKKIIVGKDSENICASN